MDPLGQADTALQSGDKAGFHAHNELEYWCSAGKDEKAKKSTHLLQYGTDFLISLITSHDTP